MHLRRGGDRASRCRHCWGVGAWRHPCTSRPSHSGDLQQPGPARAGGAGTAAPRAGAGHRGRSARRSVGGEGGRGGGSGDSGDGGEPRRGGGAATEAEPVPWLWQYVTQNDIDVVLIQEPYITGTNVVAGMPSG